MVMKTTQPFVFSSRGRAGGGGGRKEEGIEAMGEGKRWLIVGGSSVGLLLLLLLVLWVSLGVTRTFLLLAAVDFAAVLAIFAWILVRFAISDNRRLSMARRTSLEGHQLRLQYSFLRKVAGLPTRFTYRALESATRGFGPASLVGRGSSASVFKGVLEDGTPVAVKRIEIGEQQEGGGRGDYEFNAEVAAIASVQHINLLRLIGYCLSPGPPAARFLVCDYVANGSLDRWIFPPTDRHGRGRPGAETAGGCLPWDARRRVAVDVARGLAYLHHDCRARVLHLDVKPENILLDEGFRALVADFGLSKLMGRDQSRVVTTVRGTRGYLAPEWLLDHGITEKSDVYSYGMVLLEMVGGRRNVRVSGEGSQRRWSYFPMIAAEKSKQGAVMELLDARLLSSSSSSSAAATGIIREDEVVRMVNVALWCIQEKSRLRPTMWQVVDMLEGRVAVHTPPDTEMIIMDLLDVDSTTTTTQQQPQQQRRKHDDAAVAPDNEEGPRRNKFTLEVMYPRRLPPAETGGVERSQSSPAISLPYCCSISILEGR